MQIGVAKRCCPQVVDTSCKIVYLGETEERFSELQPQIPRWKSGHSQLLSYREKEPLDSTDRFQHGGSGLQVRSNSIFPGTPSLRLCHRTQIKTAAACK